MTVITNTSGKNELLQVSESQVVGRGFLEGQVFPERKKDRNEERSNASAQAEDFKTVMAQFNMQT